MGPSVYDQKLWSLSTNEYKKLNETVRIYAEKRDDNNFWWLRSPSARWDMSAMAGYVYRDDAENAIFSGVNSPNAAEIIFMPAFLMRLPEKIIMFLAF